ncbi:MAG: hypothetical protein ACOY5C_10545 [Pseudomonadota bacterium]|uniref:hypothetical protein n=1 Tax=Thermithiobacillus tepidarius TaxID=929 RepID=UPI0003FB2229|nr:hypothetical protein [Thermithiobacillus tepidarius]
MDLDNTRSTEWFVPRFGPARFRVAVGLLFLPYTGMVLAFTVVGAMLAENLHWDRVFALLLIYFLALGVGAHALDALGSKGAKPWGAVFSIRQLWTLASISVLLAYAIGLYYMILYTPLLWLIAIPEGFFLLAYNLEWFGGRFHSDGWFAFSWGVLPTLAGYVLQSNRLTPAALLVAAAMGLLSLVEIKTSRPYKVLMRQRGALDEAARAQARQLEDILKSVSAGTILLGVGLLTWRWLG